MVVSRLGGQQSQQAVKEGQLGDQVGTGQCGGSGGEEDECVYTY